MRHPVRLLAALLTALALTGPAWAGAPTDEVRQYTDHVQKILEDPALRSADKREGGRLERAK